MRQILLAFSRHRDDRSLDQYLELDASSLVQVQAGLPPATALGQPDASATLPPPGDALPPALPQELDVHVSAPALAPQLLDARTSPVIAAPIPAIPPIPLQRRVRHTASPLPPPPPPPVDNTSFACRDLLFRRHRGHWQILVEWEQEPYCATWQPASDLPDVPLESVPLLPEGEDGLTCATCDLPHARHPLFGKFIICEGTCGRGWHLGCLSKPRKRAPPGPWTCPDCSA
ncbi:hypothetical protein RI054_37g141000 [Pseudoscourfieldia marina]